jgi:hypothetical protein
MNKVLSWADRFRLPVPKQRVLWAAMLLVCSSAVATAQQRFKTPEEAIDALAAAARADGVGRLALILGRGSADILSSGDAAADEATRRAFVAAYDAKHQVKVEGEGGTKATVILGENDWPFPIPLVRTSDGVWRFNTQAGREEILYRRIGRNEFSASMACLAYVQAQREYAEMDAKNGGMGAYAQQIASSKGKKDGLYWPSAQGEPESPLGEFIAAASRSGSVSVGEPLYGYYYRILTRQGPTASGGQYDYIANGKMIGGFAMVAYPAEYGTTGVMTFLVNKDGELFEKDLGPSTARTASRMTAFNPNHTWRRVENVEAP